MKEESSSKKSKSKAQELAEIKKKEEVEQ